MSDSKPSFFWKWFVRFLAFTGFVSIFCFILIVIFSVFVFKELMQGNVAHLKINGPIMVTSEDENWWEGPGTVSSGRFIKDLEEIKKYPGIKGLLIEINSPGGTPVASEEIARAVKEFNLPKVAWIREVGASGAYWVASAADHVVVHPLSITGSIGVLANSFGFEEVMETLKIKYRRLVSGRLKDIGDPFRVQSEEEKQYLQNVLDEVHRHFIDSVRVNRKLDEEKMEQLSTGLFFTGNEAVREKLADQLGSEKEARDWLEKKLGQPVKLKLFGKRGSLMQVLLYGTRKMMMQFGISLGKGIAGEVVERKNFLWSGI